MEFKSESGNSLEIRQSKWKPFELEWPLWQEKQREFSKDTFISKNDRKSQFRWNDKKKLENFDKEIRYSPEIAKKTFNR